MTAPDMTASIVPRSDQINAEDLLTGPCIITVAAVKRGTDEQPVDIVTEEFGPGRPYKPSKTMRRVIVAAWGTNAAAYTGRRIMIYRDPDIRFGPDKVGGIRISHLSHLDRRLEIALTVTRGRRAKFTVDPLRDEPAPPESDPDAITPAQLTKLSILLKENGFDDTASARAYLTAAVKREIQSRKDLTKDEAGQVIDTLENAQEAAK